MSNLAYKVEKQQRQTKSAEQSVIIRRRASITLGEKVLIVLFALAVLSASLFMISKAFAAYQTNIEIQKLETKVETAKNRVGDLEKTADELKEPDRIMEIARKKGLNLTDKKVKNIQE
ncbi:cell division protein FtsL [Bacillus swezeyi]|uniref:Cell division protein FtsL n=1 Tax=Bacillus swezeyi TaxID=1925020 RepID=A0A1R1RYZ3_9BACI|nr:cell division protein FtsL [Bacillus swezeyi]MEC1260759.1 cell division protein FtsL [Bacillus swezeyi]MED2928696.1 cell division protein FtsL [Bacillus swezeyi]MED2943152.1 cell division protein FtsL [Bacillus swezeyi]MED2964218.1 cell division protein FtsL [Bacillus swezeyi]MED2976060.1 cell division protein FtsL [Bacillus swezeyi]